MQNHTYTTGTVAQLATRLKASARPGSVQDRLADQLARMAADKPASPQIAPSDPTVAPPGPAAYELRISESQLHYLVTALAQCQLQGYYGADAEGREEIDLLHGMLSDELEPLPICNDLTA